MTRVLELEAELLMFLQDAKSTYAVNFSDCSWLLTLVFFADLFDHLNILDKYLKGREENILTLSLSLVFRRFSTNLQWTHRW